MIKEGQIFEKTMYGIVCITCVLQGGGLEMINNKGRICIADEYAGKYWLSSKRLLAEYPTWREAVNSKEFADA